MTKNEIQKITLTPKKQQTNLPQLIQKTEPVPNCITSGESLVEQYNKTDLQFDYVYENCKTLTPLKGIEINLQMVEFWFREFIKAGWTKFIFDRQLQALKYKKVFARIDIADWFQTEIMYNEFDFNAELTRRIIRKIQHGKYLREHPEVELSEEDKEAVELALAQEMEFKRTNEKLRLVDDYQTERRRLWNQKFGM